MFHQIIIKQCCKYKYTFLNNVTAFPQVLKYSRYELKGKTKTTDRCLQRSHFVIEDDAAMPVVSLTSRSKLGFSAFPKDTSKHGLGGLNLPVMIYM